MSPLNFVWRRALVAAAFALCFFRAAAADSSLGEAAGAIPVPLGFSKTEVRDAIVAAFSAREWGVTSKTDDSVVGYLKHRSNEATVTIVYSETQIDIYCVGWQINKKTGARQKPEQPKGWLNNLKGDLTKSFNKTGPKK